ncbi:structure-specific endonuclease subunit SLX1 [Myotis yumanensis]|uniref:structure-specific endonuclease subunit SLX1 n=1 Tax=Myotis yumanensis TaxID=159337 RepID=UPI0038CF8785
MGPEGGAARPGCFFGVYLLYCLNPRHRGRVYVGFTVNPARRVQQHNGGRRKGGAWRTSGRGPWPGPATGEESEELQAICKLGTGFSDEELEEYHQTLQARVLPTPRSYVRADGAVTPDHWLEPSTVWEVRCTDLSLSPIYPAALGLVDSEKGISLRFPRFVRVREDKTPEEATTSAQVAWLYKRQSQIQNQEDTDQDSDLDLECFYWDEEGPLCCPHPGCSLRAHMTCLADEFLQEEPGQLLPLEGRCPGCKSSLLWGDLIWLCRMGSEEEENLELEEEHWTDMLEI